jgi:regulator of cell morphogenesis and NO signaling
MLDSSLPVATLVLDHSECAPVLARHRIDYCCKGTRPLAEACRELGLDLPGIVTELETAIARRGRDAQAALDPRTLSTHALIVQVIAPHHQYLHRTMPFLVTLAAKVARVHGDREPSLQQVSRIVGRIVDTLVPHLAEEEAVLFPALINGRSADVAPMLLAMRGEHEVVGELLWQLRSAADNYVAPDWGCNSYRTLMKELEVLEDDTLTHVHIENHVLLPRFVASA